MAASLLRRGWQGTHTTEPFIANPYVENDAGYAIEVVAQPDGTFTVRNDRNRFEKTYRK